MHGGTGDSKMMAARESNSAVPSMEKVDGHEMMSKTDYPLHECVYKGKIKKIPHLLKQCDIDAKDKHGKCLHIGIYIFANLCFIFYHLLYIYSLVTPSID